MEPSDYEMFGIPKTKREEVTEEQFDQDTKEIFESLFPTEQDKAEDIEAGFFQKMERFNELMTCWKSLPTYDPNFKADLAWLEENVAHYLDQKERGSMQQPCPFHPLDILKVLNPEAEFGPLYCKCPVDDCPVWCTTETAHVVLPELTQNTHPEVRAKITQLRCKCGYVPRMKLSRTDRNFQRLFLTCGQHRAEPCGYFQWLHAPLWKPKRPTQLTLEQFPRRQSTPVGEYAQKKVRWPADRPNRPDRFASGFRPPPSAFGENRPFGRPADNCTFEQLCDERNAERVKHNCAPYSYDTYRQYGFDIF